MSLKKAGIERVGMESYRCLKCGVVWSPNLRKGGRLPKGWWRCPNKCNKEVLMPGQKASVTPVMNIGGKRSTMIEKYESYSVVKDSDGEISYICNKCGKTMDRSIVKETFWNTTVRISCPTCISGIVSRLVSEHFEPDLPSESGGD